MPHVRNKILYAIVAATKAKVCIGNLEEVSAALLVSSWTGNERSGLQTIQKYYRAQKSSKVGPLLRGHRDDSFTWMTRKVVTPQDGVLKPYRARPPRKVRSDRYHACCSIAIIYLTCLRQPLSYYLLFSAEEA